MNRTLHKVHTRYVIELTPVEYKTLLLRDVERILSGLDNLKELLYDTYSVYDVSIMNQGVYLSILTRNSDYEHELILNDIECYVEGIENFWTGLDNGEEMG